MSTIINAKPFKQNRNDAGFFPGALTLESAQSKMEMLQMISDTHDSSGFQGGTSSSTKVLLAAARTIAAGYWFTFRLGT